MNSHRVPYIFPDLPLWVPQPGYPLFCPFFSCELTQALPIFPVFPRTSASLQNEVYIAWLFVWMHSFVSYTRVSLKRITCLHKFTERGIHCMASCFISFVCKRVSSHKVESTSSSNESCQLVSSRDDSTTFPPPIHAVWPFPVTVVRLPVGFVNFR